MWHCPVNTLYNFQGTSTVWSGVLLQQHGHATLILHFVCFAAFVLELVIALAEGTGLLQYYGVDGYANGFDLLGKITGATLWPCHPPACMGDLRSGPMFLRA
jgi:hypothetical protein